MNIYFYGSHKSGALSCGNPQPFLRLLTAKTPVLIPAASFGGGAFFQKHRLAYGAGRRSITNQD
ncbi:MAG: hypothetical protein Q4C86_08700 [bacterium]|nr:hypothetical protein [bacterium]